MSEVILNEEQEQVRKLIEETKEHVFVTGKAGTGKSTLLRAIEKSTRKICAVVAPTGVAAVNVEGSTIHSFFGIPIDVTEEIDIKPWTRKLLSRVQMVIIDEISMVRVDMMDKIDQICQAARDSDAPFGGLQIVMFGDVYQLPPVIASEGEQKHINEYYGGGMYFFDADVWKESKFKTFELQTIFRQRDDKFISILNTIRNRDSKNLVAALKDINERVYKGEAPEGVPILCATKNKVNQINKLKLKEIDKPEFTYEALIGGSFSKNAYPAPVHLTLKEGAQVMMLNNDPLKRWVNGTMAIVHSLTESEIRVKIKDTVHLVSRNEWIKGNYTYNYYNGNGRLEKKSVGQFVQFPLTPAWAITIHKSQGKTLEAALIDMHFGAFTTGQAYVALSRCTTIEKLYLRRSLKRKDIMVDKRVVEFMNKEQMKDLPVSYLENFEIKGGLCYGETLTAKVIKDTAGVQRIEYNSQEKTPEEKAEIIERGNKAMEDLYG